MSLKQLGYQSFMHHLLRLGLHQTTTEYCQLGRVSHSQYTTQPHHQPQPQEHLHVPPLHHDPTSNHSIITSLGRIFVSTPHGRIITFFMLVAQIFKLFGSVCTNVILC